MTAGLPRPSQADYEAAEALRLLAWTMPCAYCGVMMDYSSPATVPTRDHIWTRLVRSISEGRTGKVWCCHKCNTQKGDMLPAEWLAVLLAQRPGADALAERHATFAKTPAMETDMPETDLSRDPDALLARIQQLEEENAKLRKLDVEYGQVETAIIMADREFDGDEEGMTCGERLVISVNRLRDLAYPPAAA